MIPSPSEIKAIFELIVIDPSFWAMAFILLILTNVSKWFLCKIGTHPFLEIFINTIISVCIGILWSRYYRGM